MLEIWCVEQGFVDMVKVWVVCVEGVVCDVLFEVCEVLQVEVDVLLCYCCVCLVCGICVLFEVDNWYVFDLFMFVMNVMLDGSDELFGCVVKLFGFQCQMLGDVICWFDCGEGLQVIVLEVCVVLCDYWYCFFSYVIECYLQGVLF